MIDIRERIRKELETSSSADPTVIADAVFADVPKEDHEHLARTQIREMVRHLISVERRTVEPLPNPVKSSHSRKGERIRNDWRRKLRMKINTGIKLDDWKFLSQCTYDDLMYAAQYRNDLAAANLHQAKVCEKRANAIAEHNVKTFGDLPEDVQRALLEDSDDDDE